MASLATSSNNQEVRRLTDAGVVPDWFPRIQKIWMHAMGHISHLDLASQDSPRRFVLPPIHLFWGAEPENQRIYYYHYLLLFNEIKNRPECNLPALMLHFRRTMDRTISYLLIFLYRDLLPPYHTQMHRTAPFLSPYPLSPLSSIVPCTIEDRKSVV